MAERLGGSPGRDVIVIGASAGGVEALKTLVAKLPCDLPAAILVVLHLAAGAPSLFPDILRKVGRMPTLHPAPREPLVRGRIYVAPPDHHMVLQDGYVVLTQGPKENRHRPAIDPLFRSAALHYGPRVVGIVLTGALDDGTAGLKAIKSRGGATVVQDPHEALYPSMPRSAIENVDVDHVVRLDEMPSLLASLVRQPARGGPLPSDKLLEVETSAAEMTMGVEDYEGLVSPSTLTCPDCHGALYEVGDDGVLRFRCRTGHAYTVNALSAEQSDAVERALYVALRSLEESAAIGKRLGAQARSRGRLNAVARFDTVVRRREEEASQVRSLLRRDAAVRDYDQTEAIADEVEEI